MSSKAFRCEKTPVEDVRYTPPDLPYATAEAHGKRLLLLGTDCALGKKYRR